MAGDTPEGGRVEVRALEMRPVQVAALDGIAKHWRNVDGQDRRALVILPTGVGKTITALEAVRRAVARGVRCLWVAHREELVMQPYETVHAVAHFAEVAEVAGVVKGNRDDHAAQVVFTSVQTMRHRGERYLSHGRPGLVVVDEAHHYAPGSSWYATVLALIGADAETGTGGGHVIGLTATPQRGDNVALAAMWGAAPAYYYGITDAIEAGYLLPPRFERVPMEMSPELQAAMDICNADGASDVSKAAAKALIDEGIAEHTADVVAMGGDHTLVYCASVAQVHATVEAIEAAGRKSAGAITGETPAKRRHGLLQSFMRGDVDVLVNCDVLTEGTDLPIADTIVLARPCGSKALYVQIVGRGARLYPGQDHFRVLDILGASDVHSLEQAPVLDVGAEAVDDKRAGNADLSIVASVDIEDEYVIAPQGSLWTADVVEVGERASGADPWCGVVKIRGPYERSLGGRPVGQFAPVEGRRPELLVEVGQGRPWSVYHAVRIPRGITGEDWAVAWVSIYPDCQGVDIGRDGTCYLIQHHEDADRWWPVRIAYRGRKVQLLATSAVQLGVANLVVRDVVRRSGDNDRAKLIHGNAGWRNMEVTPGQRAMMDARGIEEVVRTRGEATVAITRAILKEKVDRYGLRSGWEP